MIGYVLRRFANYAILSALATIGSYIVLSSFMDPTRRYLGRNPPMNPESVTRIVDDLGVNPDIPVMERTWAWLGRIVTEGSLGNTVGQTPVIEEIALRAGVSLRLLIVGSLLAAVLGVVIGVWGAVRQYKASDTVLTYASFVLISTPTFVAGVVLMILATQFNRLVGDQVIRFTGAYTASEQTSFASSLADTASHMLLPTIALVGLGAATFSRYQRSIMLDVLGADYIRTARAKGCTRRRALVRHGVRVAIIPMSTFFAFSFGTLLTGSVFLEIVFSWNGMGQFTINAITQSDINAATGAVAFTAVLVLASSTLAEVLNAVLDPRVRT